MKLLRQCILNNIIINKYTMDELNNFLTVFDHNTRPEMYINVV